jgi:hypothetical protein
MSMTVGTGGTRCQLKQPNGWFAAGREVECALQLLSDAAFKLFLWLCLHAERSRGSLSAPPTELAAALGRSESHIQVALEELQRRKVCVVSARGVIEISDRFWPYRRSCDPAGSDEALRYVEEVKRLFLERRCVQSRFTVADEKLARPLYRQAVPLIQVERAILLGAVRKYSALRQHGRGTPISSLHYFHHLFVEVRQEISTQYWQYVAKKVKAFEQEWTGFTSDPGLESRSE